MMQHKGWLHMHPLRRRRLLHVIWVACAVSAGVAVIMMNLKQHIELYQTPTELLQHAQRQHQTMMLGGLVRRGSVQHLAPMTISFQVTDFQHDVTVRYRGVLPALFREGQGVVIRGRLNDAGLFIGQQVLAKHDEHYHPPGVAQPLPASHTMRRTVHAT